MFNTYERRNPQTEKMIKFLSNVKIEQENKVIIQEQLQATQKLENSLRFLQDSVSNNPGPRKNFFEQLFILINKKFESIDNLFIEIEYLDPVEIRTILTEIESMIDWIRSKIGIMERFHYGVQLQMVS